jgi:hypothetical protein
LDKYKDPDGDEQAAAELPRIKREARKQLREAAAAGESGKN